MEIQTVEGKNKTANSEALPYPLLNQLQTRIVNADNAERAPHSSRPCVFSKFSLIPFEGRGRHIGTEGRVSRNSVHTQIC